MQHVEINVTASHWLAAYVIAVLRMLANDPIRRPEHDRGIKNLLSDRQGSFGELIGLYAVEMHTCLKDITHEAARFGGPTKGVDIYATGRSGKPRRIEVKCLLMGENKKRFLINGKDEATHYLLLLAKPHGKAVLVSDMRPSDLQHPEKWMHYESMYGEIGTKFMWLDDFVPAYFDDMSLGEANEKLERAGTWDHLEGIGERVLAQAAPLRAAVAQKLAGKEITKLRFDEVVDLLVSALADVGIKLE